MSLYDLIECNDNYFQNSGSLWQYYRDESHVTLTNSELLSSKVRFSGRTPAADRSRR